MICNEQGLHARPSSALIKVAQEFESAILIRNLSAGTEADGKFLLEVMTLAAAKGTELEISAEGCDADDAVLALAQLISGGFGEFGS